MKWFFSFFFFVIYLVILKVSEVIPKLIGAFQLTQIKSNVKKKPQTKFENTNFKLKTTVANNLLIILSS